MKTRQKNRLFRTLMTVGLSLTAMLAGCNTYPPIDRIHVGMAMGEVLSEMNGDRGEKHYIMEGIVGQEGGVVWEYPQGKVEFRRNNVTAVYKKSADGNYELIDPAPQQTGAPHLNTAYSEFRSVPQDDE